MGGIALWVRSVLRRRIGATVALALLAGLSAGIVGAAFQAARRADGAVQRHGTASRSYDFLQQGCPSEVGDPGELSFPDLIAHCVSNDAARRLATEVVAPMPQVESWTTVGFLVAAVFDDAAWTGWGYGALVQAVGSPDAAGVVRRQILLDGRFADDRAPDELVIGELTASAAHLGVGDRIRVASWNQQDLDAAADGGLRPQTPPFESTIVGIVRTEKDVQIAQANITGAFLPDGLYAGPGWTTAHADGMAQYGFGVAVRLKDGPAMVEPFTAAMKQRAVGWFLAPRDTLNEVDQSTLNRVVEAERQAVLISAWIAVVAAVVFTGLTLARQLRRELADWKSLIALGVTRRGLVIGTVIRAMVIGAIASLLAIATVVALSPLGPLGIARHLEYSHPIRFDWVVLGCVLIAAPVLIGAIAALAAWVAVRAKRRRVESERRTSRWPLGAVTRAALNFVHDGSPRLAVAVGAVAVAGAVAAGALVASFDSVVSRPVKYGAWWDVAVGQYSDPDVERAGVAAITSNPMVSDAAGVLEDVNTALVDGVTVPYVSLVPYLGRADAVMHEGRSPTSAGEAALGAATARRLHKRIGDTVTITVSTLAKVDETLKVTGIAVLNNPVTVASNAGDGILLHPDLAVRLDVGSQVPQSIVVRFSPTADRAAAMKWIFAEFPGTARLASPQADLTNLQRLRFVPWLIAALVGALALGSLIHALVTLLQRHARDIAVLGALGMTRRERRRIGIGSSIVIVAGCIAVGVPLGLVLGGWIWRVVGRRISIPSSAVIAWGPTLLAPMAAFAIGLVVAAVASRWVTRRTPGAQLHTE
jgi:hypothetical protein